MKAQSLRRTLWFGSTLLALGVAGGAAWYFTSVRNAAAADDSWVKKAYDDFQVQRQTAKPSPTWPVSLAELEAHVTRPDLTKKESRIGVWPYVGPVPPPPREIPVEGPKADLPKGLAAIGNPSMVWMLPGSRPSLVKWIF